MGHDDAKGERAGQRREEERIIKNWHGRNFLLAIVSTLILDSGSELSSRCMQLKSADGWLDDWLAIRFGVEERFSLSSVLNGKWKAEAD